MLICYHTCFLGGNKVWIINEACQYLHFLDQEYRGEMPYPRSHGKSEKEPILETRSPDSWLSVYWAIFIHTTIPFEFSFSPSPPHQNSLQKGNFTRHSHSVIDPSNRKCVENAISEDSPTDKNDIWAGRLKGNEGANHVDVWKKLQTEGAAKRSVMVVILGSKEERVWQGWRD